jgi:hypothetical protein
LNYSKVRIEDKTFTVHSEVAEAFSTLRTRNCELDAQIKELQQWKDSALEVLNELNLQEIGKELNVKLGAAIGPEILPRILDLKWGLQWICSNLAGIENEHAERACAIARTSLNLITNSKDKLRLDKEDTRLPEAEKPEI